MSDMVFRFKQFSVAQQCASMKINTDGVLLGAWVTVGHAQRILDVGSGSGVIALMLAQRSNFAVVDAVEKDIASAEQARQNFMNSPWKNRMKIYIDTFQTFAEQSVTLYDLIVSNPPYFTDALCPASEKRLLSRHTKELSHYELLAGTKKILHHYGALCVILPIAEGNKFIESAGIYSFFCSHKTIVYTSPNKPPKRLLLRFVTEKTQMTESTLFIHSHDGSFTHDYKTFTKDFYLKF